jgi:hypothetical protein
LVFTAARARTSIRLLLQQLRDRRQTDAVAETLQQHAAGKLLVELVERIHQRFSNLKKLFGACNNKLR